MAEPNNILLEYMRRFDGRQARFEDPLRDISARLTSIESCRPTMHGDVTRDCSNIHELKRAFEAAALTPAILSRR